MKQGAYLVRCNPRRCNPGRCDVV